MSEPTKPDVWMPHAWEGMGSLAWFTLLYRHRFAVHARFLWVGAIVNVVSFLHSVLWLIQEIFHGHRLRRAPKPRDPIFILGHWRSGTTLLHELLIRDPRHAFPTTYQCFEPNHFLLTERFFQIALPFLMPSRRPMDDMPAGWDRPQEDEFALCMLGARSPYLHMAFPNQPARDLDYLDFRGVPESARSRWSLTLANFLSRVSCLNPGRRLVLKSPAHTARIPTLLARFPNARFVHIVRNPYLVYPSTVRLWKTLYCHNSLQSPSHEHVERFVQETGRRLFDSFENHKGSIPAGQFIEVRYEDLVADPIGQLKRIYAGLGLGAAPGEGSELRQYIAAMPAFQGNRHKFCRETADTVNRHWGDVVRRYGYAPPGSEPAMPAVTSSLPAEPLLASTP